VPSKGRSLPVRVAGLPDRELYHGPRVSGRSDRQGSPVLPVLTISQSRAGRGGALRASPFIRNHDTIVNRVAEDAKLTPAERLASAAIVADMVPTLSSAFDALSDAAMPDAARLRRGARRRRGGDMGGGTNEVRLTVDLVRTKTSFLSRPRSQTPLSQEAPPHDGERDHVLYVSSTLVVLPRAHLLPVSNTASCTRYYNIVLFLTTADPVAADGPPSTWRVLAFPHQQIAFTIQHATVLVSLSAQQTGAPPREAKSLTPVFAPKQVWLPQFSPHFQSCALSEELSFNQVTLSAQLQHHPAVVDPDGYLAREEDAVAARRAALVGLPERPGSRGACGARVN